MRALRSDERVIHMSALTLQDVKDRLRVDFADEMTDRDLTRYIEEANMYSRGALGAGYPADDERVKSAQCDYIRLSYDSANISEKERSALEKRIERLHTQVRLEMRLAGDDV